MPCAGGELCAQPDTTPQDPHGHGCQGGCGGRLHGIWGSVVDDDNENHRICSACVAKGSKRKASAADSAGRAQSKMTAQLAETRVSTGREEEDEQEDSSDENTGLARRAPLAYSELSSHFGVMEAAAEESGNGNAALYLAKAKTAMIAAHSTKRLRQADMREFVAAE